MKIFILADQLYRLGFTKESQNAYGLGNVMQTWDFDVDNTTDQEIENDFKTFEEGGATTVDDTSINQNMNPEGSPKEFKEKASNKLWENAPLKRDHKIIIKLREYFTSIWPSITGVPGSSINAKDSSKAAGIFKYFDQNFKDKMDRPGWVIQSGMAIPPAQAMEIISLAVQEFLITVPDTDYQYGYLKELQEWAHGLYQEYADYYYENVDSSGRDERHQRSVDKVDQTPALSEENFNDLQRRMDEGQRRWEQAEGHSWSSEDLD